MATGNHTWHLLTVEQENEVIRLYKDGMSKCQVAKVFRCSPGTVLNILKRNGVPRRSVHDAMIGRSVLAETRAKIASKAKGNKRGAGKRSAAFRRKMSEVAKARGESHNFRIDGKGDERRIERKRSMQQIEYRLWRESVFKRDDFTCQECGKRGGELHADHIKPWKSHPELRYDVSNGRTLCVQCHRETPTYGNKPLS